MRTLLLLPVVVALAVDIAASAPIRLIPNLRSASAHEVTGSTTAWGFLAAGPELTARLPGALSSSNRDFFGLGNEHYDIYYSDAAGNFDIDGEYVSIECEFPQTFGGGGGNIAECSLDITGTGSIFASAVVSSVTLGVNAIPSSVGNAADGNLATLTTLGNNAGTSQRLRVTLCYIVPGYSLPPCTVGVEADTWENVKSLYR